MKNRRLPRPLVLAIIAGLAVSSSCLAGTQASGVDTTHSAGHANSRDGKRVASLSANAAPVSVVVTLKKGSTVMSRFFVTALDGVASPLGSSTRASYVTNVVQKNGKTSLDTRSADLGVGVSVTPDLMPDGRIHLSLVLTKRTLTSIDTVKESGTEVQLPQITSFTIDQQMMLEDGKPVTVLVGGDVQSGYSVTVTARRV